MRILLCFCAVVFAIAMLPSCNSPNAVDKGGSVDTVYINNLGGELSWSLFCKSQFIPSKIINNVFYCQGEYQLLKSNDTGKSWQVCFNDTNHGDQSGFLNCGSTFFFYSWEVNLNYDFNAQLFKSDDLGATWTRVTNGLSSQDAASAVVSVGSVYYLATGCGVNNIGYSGIFRSTDFGSSWTKVMNGLPIYDTIPYYMLAASPARAFVCIANRTNKIWRIDNAGSTWEQILIPGLTDSFAVYGIQYRNGRLFITCRNKYASDDRRYFISDNEGGSWSSAVLIPEFQFSIGDTIFGYLPNSYSKDNGSSWYLLNASNFPVIRTFVYGNYLYRNESGYLYRCPLGNLKL